MTIIQRSSSYLPSETKISPSETSACYALLRLFPPDRKRLPCTSKSTTSYATGPLYYSYETSIMAAVVTTTTLDHRIFYIAASSKP